MFCFIQKKIFAHLKINRTANIGCKFLVLVEERQMYLQLDALLLKLYALTIKKVGWGSLNYFFS